MSVCMNLSSFVKMLGSWMGIDFQEDVPRSMLLAQCWSYSISDDFS